MFGIIKFWPLSFLPIFLRTNISVTLFALGMDNFLVPSRYHYI